MIHQHLLELGKKKIQHMFNSKYNILMRNDDRYDYEVHWRGAEISHTAPPPPKLSVKLFFPPFSLLSLSRTD